MQQANELPDVALLRKRLKRYKLSAIAKETGINRHQLYRIVNEDSRPSYETVRILLQWMAEHE